MPPIVTSSITGGIRITIAIVVAVILGLFMLVWDSRLYYYGIPHWLGSVVFLPLIAILLNFGGDCLVEQLSCGKVSWLIQLQRAAVVPIPFWFMSFILYWVPLLRWPIEGLAQSATLSTKQGLSSGFYTFWVGMYVQSLLINLSQFC